jgi:hypothetical protein
MSDSVVLLFVGGHREIPAVSMAWSGCRVHALATPDPEARLSASLCNDGAERGASDDVHTHVVDFTDTASVSALLLTLAPFRALVVWPTFDLTGLEGWEDAIRNTMGQCFSAVQASYLPLLRQRKGALWIVSPGIVPSVSNAANMEACLQPCFRGLASLAGVVAMELAKKNVIANYLSRGDGPSGSQQAVDLIRWSIEQPRAYLTAEHLSLCATRQQ